MPIRKLKAITEFDEDTLSSPYGERFLKSIAPSIERLNEAIDAYNRERDAEKKLGLLRLLYTDLQDFTHSCSDELVAICPQYAEEIHQKLFVDIKREFGELGVFSVRPETLPEDPFAEVVANFLPETLSQLAEILGTPKYWREPFPKAAEIETILGKRYQIVEKLRSANNQSFKVKDRETGKYYLLQLEARQGVTRNAEMHLRKHGLSQVFLPVLESRQTSYLWGGESGIRQTRNVLVMDYISDIKTLEQDNETYAETQTRLNSALNIYTQMAEVLGVIEASGCVFPDMKNSNWLIDASGTLRISDGKSFLFANAEKQLDVHDQEGKNGTYDTCVSSPYMNPPEGFKDKPLVSQLHAYMLGRNLYQYLTQCDNAYLLKKGNRFEAKPLEQLDFSHEIFQSSTGMALEALIKSLMSDNPKERPSLDEARQILLAQTPENRPFRNTAALYECIPLLNQIDSFRVTARGVRDVEMDKFLKEMHARMLKVQSPAEKNVLKAELKATLDSLKDSKEVVDDIQARMKQSGYDMKAKGRRIGEALAAVPLTQRGQIFTVKERGTKETEAVLKAMASHRTSWRRFTKEGREGILDEKKSATMFKEFRGKFQGWRNAESAKKSKDLENEHENNPDGSKPGPK